MTRPELPSFSTLLLPFKKDLNRLVAMAMRPGALVSNIPFCSITRHAPFLGCNAFSLYMAAALTAGPLTTVPPGLCSLTAPFTVCILSSGRVFPRRAPYIPQVSSHSGWWPIVVMSGPLDGIHPGQMRIRHLKTSSALPPAAS